MYYLVGSGGSVEERLEERDKRERREREKERKKRERRERRERREKRKRERRDREQREKDREKDREREKEKVKERQKREEEREKEKVEERRREREREKRRERPEGTEGEAAAEETSLIALPPKVAVVFLMIAGLNALTPKFTTESIFLRYRDGVFFPCTSLILHSPLNIRRLYSTISLHKEEYNWILFDSRV
jgi:hypothetical protein